MDRYIDSDSSSISSSSGGDVRDATSICTKLYKFDFNKTQFYQIEFARSKYVCVHYMVNDILFSIFFFFSNWSQLPGIDFH